MYKVIVECEPDCEGWEPSRVMLETEDADEAIMFSSNRRDQLHSSWVDKA